jgi:hypothetical protein
MLSREETGKTQNIGDFVVVEQSGKRLRIEVHEGIPQRSLRRLINLILLHAKHDKTARLNTVEGNREKSFGQINKLTKSRLKQILLEGGIFIIVGKHDPIGGSFEHANYSPLTSQFFNQSSLAKLMMTRYVV